MDLTKIAIYDHKSVKKMQNRVKVEKYSMQTHLEVDKKKLPRVVQVKFEFLRIGRINTMGESFEAEINFEATWTENEIIREYDSSIYWNPIIYVENLLIERTSAVTYTLRHVDESTVITEHHNIKGIHNILEI